MGSLDYISPDANVAAAFVVKQPSALVDDILGFIETAAPDFGKHLKQAEVSTILICGLTLPHHLAESLRLPSMGQYCLRHRGRWYSK